MINKHNWILKLANQSRLGFSACILLVTSCTESKIEPPFPSDEASVDTDSSSHLLEGTEQPKYPVIVRINQDNSLPTLREVRMGDRNLSQKIELNRGYLTIDEIQIDTERWKGEKFGLVQIALPYETMSWAVNEQKEAFLAWDPIVAGGPAVLVAQEYVTGGSAPGSHRWVMRIFLWEDGALRELPPIPGSGEVYYFKDLNHDGSLEFVNTEGVGALPQTEDGLPMSPRVYRFNDERYVPVTEKAI